MNPDKLYIATYFENNEKKRISINHYNSLIDAKDQKSLTNFIFNRLHSRYIKPFQFEHPIFRNEYCNSFSVMANSCLLIETLESFKQGLKDTNSKSKEIFINFLQDEKPFEALKNHAEQFYINVRCSILHQGETSGGWTFYRDQNSLFDAEKLRINPFLFLSATENSLINYINQLEISEWESVIWMNYRKKMNYTILKCSRPR